MAKVELKQPIVDEIINNVKDAESVVLVNYSCAFFASSSP